MLLNKNTINVNLLVDYLTLYNMHYYKSNLSFPLKEELYIYGVGYCMYGDERCLNKHITRLKLFRQVYSCILHIVTIQTTQILFLMYDLMV